MFCNKLPDVVAAFTVSTCTMCFTRVYFAFTRPTMHRAAFLLGLGSKAAQLDFIPVQLLRMYCCIEADTKPF